MTYEKSLVNLRGACFPCSIVSSYRMAIAGGDDSETAAMVALIESRSDYLAAAHTRKHVEDGEVRGRPIGSTKAVKRPTVIDSGRPGRISLLVERLRYIESLRLREDSPSLFDNKLPSLAVLAVA